MDALFVLFVVCLNDTFLSELSSAFSSFFGGSEKEAEGKATPTDIPASDEQAEDVSDSDEATASTDKQTDKV